MQVNTVGKPQVIAISGAILLLRNSKQSVQSKRVEKGHFICLDKAFGDWVKSPFKEKARCVRGYGDGGSDFVVC